MSAAADSSDPAVPLYLEIVNLAGTVWSGAVRAVTLPGIEGALGVLPRHAPLLTRLREGQAHIEPVAGEALSVYLSGGFAEIQPHRVMVLADLAVRSADRDAARAEVARRQVSDTATHEFYGPDYDAVHAEMVQSFGVLIRSLSRPDR